MAEMSPLRKSPYSYHFTALSYLGAWLYETKDPLKLNLYVTYKVFVTALGLYGVFGLGQNFYFVFGDIKKMTWNLCVTSLLVGTLVKNFQMLLRNKTINSLRSMLHRDAQSRFEPQHLSIHNDALKELRFLRMSFYGTATVFIPTWFLGRYLRFFWGIKELPIPLHLPQLIDIDQDWQFHCTYVVLGVSAIFGMAFAMETELAMYGLLIQISREYKVLIKDILNINALYEDDDTLTTIREMNPWLRNLKTKMLLKTLSARQKTLIEYTDSFESCFNKPLLQELFGMSVLIVALALQCLWESVELSPNLFYQMGYLFINVVDMFLICLFSTRLRTQCLEVGEAMYSVVWYRMKAEMQRDVVMIIMRSQHPPKITIGKFKELGLDTFMAIMGNLYSWLTLFRQVEAKSSSK